LVDTKDVTVNRYLLPAGLRHDFWKIPADSGPYKRKAREGQRTAWGLENEGSGVFKKMEVGVPGKMGVGDGSAFMVTGHKIYGSAAASHLLERLKCHFNQQGRDLTAVQNVTAMDDGVHLPL
jgi:hypothetical protein